MFLSQKKSEKEYSMQNKNLVFTPSISFQELSQVSDDLFTKPLRFDLGIHPHESDHISHIFCKSEPSMWCLTKAYKGRTLHWRQSNRFRSPHVFFPQNSRKVCFKDIELLNIFLRGGTLKRNTTNNRSKKRNFRWNLSDSKRNCVCARSQCKFCAGVLMGQVFSNNRKAHTASESIR